MNSVSKGIEHRHFSGHNIKTEDINFHSDSKNAQSIPYISHLYNPKNVKEERQHSRDH